MWSLYGVWPLPASMEVENKHAYVITQDICNKFIQVNVFVGCMVSLPNRLLQRSTTMSLINKIFQEKVRAYWREISTQKNKCDATFI